STGCASPSEPFAGTAARRLVVGARTTPLGWSRRVRSRPAPARHPASAPPLRGGRALLCADGGRERELLRCLRRVPWPRQRRPLATGDRSPPARQRVPTVHLRTCTLVRWAQAPGRPRRIRAGPELV